MPASKMLDDLKTILSLYRQFDRYNKYTDKELLFYILPSYELNQYKIHKQGEEVIAFTNWAFLNKNAEKQFPNAEKLELELNKLVKNKKKSSWFW